MEKKLYADATDIGCVGWSSIGATMICQPKRGHVMASERKLLMLQRDKEEMA
jgi:hypothetical protein